MNTTSETLNRAADLIEERGWVKGTGWDLGDGGNLCLEGAIQAASGVAEWGISTCPAGLAVKDYLDWHGGLGRSFLFQWNDAYDRTASEVVEVLRAAAVVEAARESAPASVGASA